MLTVAIGVGANTAIFTVIRSVLLRPLPYADADRLVLITESWPGLSGPRPVSRQNYLDWVAQSSAFERTAAVSWGAATISSGAHPTHVDGALVSPSYFDVFGLHAELGRTFMPADGELGHEHVVVLSHRLWMSQFGGDPGLVGAEIRLDGEPYTVLSVMPAGTSVHFLDPPIWRPLTIASMSSMAMTGAPSRGSHDLQWVVAKLKTGVTIAQARAQLDAIASRLAAQYPDTNKGYGVIVEPHGRPVGLGVEASLQLLFAAVGLVLLIACANVASLALVRGAARAREVAIRAALGAGRADIFRQFLAEQMVLAVAGGLAGVLFANIVLRLLLPMVPSTGLRTAFAPDAVIAIDRTVLIFAMALSLAGGIVTALAPAFGSARGPLVDTIRLGTPGLSAGRAERRLRRALVAAEVAVAFVLLTGAALVIQSFFTLAGRVAAGFDAANVLTAELPDPPSRFGSGTAVNAHYDRIADRIQAIPGVRDVAFADTVPTHGTPYGKRFLIGGQPPVPLARRPPCGIKVISPSYFRAVGLRLIAGRALTADDREGASEVLVVNQAMVRTYFPNSDPLGQRLLLPRSRIAPTDSIADVSWTIVGVVADEGVSPYDDRTTQPAVYVTRAQHPRTNLALVVRTGVDPLTLQEPIRKAVAALDRDQAVSTVKTLAQLIAEDVAADRLRSILLGAFASMAVLLTALGLYGVIAYGVAQRTREIGIRAALGASRGRLMSLVFGEAAILVGLGLAAGAVASLAATRALTTFLFGVAPADPRTMAAVVLILVGVGAAASYVPARRVVQVDPLVALKTE